MKKNWMSTKYLVLFIVLTLAWTWICGFIPPVLFGFTGTGIGTFVFYCFLGSFFGLVGIVTLIMLIATSRSIPDLVSGTYVVYDIPANNQRSEEPKDEIKPDYHEVNNDYNETDNNSKEEDDQDKYSIDDDDYKIV